MSKIGVDELFGSVRRSKTKKLGGAGRRAVQYVASLPRERDYVALGRTVSGNKKCVIYRRPGGFSVAFVAGQSQLKKIWSNEGTINITSKAIEDARRFSCEGSLSGAKRRRR